MSAAASAQRLAIIGCGWAGIRHATALTTECDPDLVDLVLVVVEIDKMALPLKRCSPSSRTPQPAA